jgi:Mn-dependent DtxR family transcriptional regulator
LNTLSEENYLKAILKATEGESHSVSTNTLAEILCHKPPTVTDMIQRLSAKKLISYEKYKGVSITETGRSVALKVIRKHRLWEVFLVEKLGMGWHEVHDIAEQLEHVQSDFLTERLNQYLQFPQLTLMVILFLMNRERCRSLIPFDSQRPPWMNHLFLLESLIIIPIFWPISINWGSSSDKNSDYFLSNRMTKVAWFRLVNTRLPSP